MNRNLIVDVTGLILVTNAVTYYFTRRYYKNKLVTKDDL